MTLTNDEQLLIRVALRDRVHMLDGLKNDEYFAALELLKKFAKAYVPIVEVEPIAGTVKRFVEPEENFNE